VLPSLRINEIPAILQTRYDKEHTDNKENIYTYYMYTFSSDVILGSKSFTTRPISEVNRNGKTWLGH